MRGASALTGWGVAVGELCMRGASALTASSAAMSPTRPWWPKRSEASTVRQVHL